MSISSYTSLTNPSLAPFSDPFDDLASKSMPRSFREALRWCEAVVFSDGVYRAAIDKIVSYFITEIQVLDVDKEKRDAILECLHDQIGITEKLKAIGFDYLTYGNSFISVLRRTTRNVFCPACDSEVPLSRLSSDVQLAESGELYGMCPVCKRPGTLKIFDHEGHGVDSLFVKRWDIYSMHLRYDVYTDTSMYIWDPPEDYRRSILEGDMLSLQYAPKVVLDAVKENKAIQLSDGLVMHAACPAPCGLPMRGWGLSPVLSNLRQSFYLQVLRRYNEAMGMDYLIPLRFITPAPQSGQGATIDPMIGMDATWHQAIMTDMLRWRRQDPMAWFILPYPVQLVTQDPGNRQFITTQLMDQALDTLLTSVGIPVEMYKMSLGVQSAPVAMRLFESYWSHLSRALNRALRFIVSKIAAVEDWGEVNVRLARPAEVDDANRQMAKIQLMMGGALSRSEGLKSLGIDFYEDQRRIMEEEQFLAEQVGETKKRMEELGLAEELSATVSPMMAVQDVMAGQQGAAPEGGGGAPPAGAAMPPAGGDIDQLLAQLPIGPNQKVSPQEIQQIAQTLASQLFRMYPTNRISALRKLKNKNWLVWAATTNALDEMRQDAMRQGLVAAQQGQMG